MTKMGQRITENYKDGAHDHGYLQGLSVGAQRIIKMGHRITET